MAFAQVGSKLFSNGYCQRKERQQLYSLWLLSLADLTLGSPLCPVCPCTQPHCNYSDYSSSVPTKEVKGAFIQNVSGRQKATNPQVLADPPQISISDS